MFCPRQSSPGVNVGNFSACRHQRMRKQHTDKHACVNTQEKCRAYLQLLVWLLVLTTHYRCIWHVNTTEMAVQRFDNLSVSLPLPPPADKVLGCSTRRTALLDGGDKRHATCWQLTLSLRGDRITFVGGNVSNGFFSETLIIFLFSNGVHIFRVGLKYN